MTEAPDGPPATPQYAPSRVWEPTPNRSTGMQGDPADGDDLDRGTGSARRGVLFSADELLAMAEDDDEVEYGTGSARRGVLFTPEELADLETATQGGGEAVLDTESAQRAGDAGADDGAAMEPETTDAADSGAPATEENVAEGTRIVLSPGRGYVIGLGVLTAIGVALFAWVVFGLGRATIYWPLLLSFLPYVILMSILWYQVARPAVLVVDPRGISLKKPLGRTVAAAWPEVRDLTVRPYGSADLETGPIIATWTTPARTVKLPVISPESRLVQAALRAHAPGFDDRS